jgi:predicted dehydrogenase
MSKRKLRVAVVGLGKMGLVHAGILNILPDVQVAALCEKSNLIRRFSRKIFKGIETVDDVEKLSKLNLDIVYVTTPIPSHFSVAKAIFVNEIASNLFIEKTLAQTYEQSKQLIELAQSSAGTNMVGYLRRFYVTFNKARDLILKGTIGKTISFKAYAYSSDFLGTEKGTQTFTARGGVLRDLGCHAVDLASWFFGDLEVSSVRRVPNDYNPEESFNFTVENSGAEGEFDVSWCKKDYRLPEVGFSIAGSKGKLDVNDDEVRLSEDNGGSHLWYRHDLDDNVPFWLALPEYYREDQHFVRSAMESSKAEPDFQAAAKVDKIIDEVEKKAGERD